MDAQELRNLQESYSQVYEGAEGGRFEYNQRHGRPLITPEVSQSRSSQETLGGGTYVRGPKRLPKSKRKYDRQVLSGVRAASEQEKERARKRMGIKEDIYDIILSHLLDEGYAETQEAAEVIMVNMSEDWRESIVEVSERGQELAWKTGQAANRALSRTTDPKKRAALHGLQHAAANRSLGGEYPDTPDMRVGGKPVRKVHDVRRGGTGEGDPDSDRGGGHRAARR